jgi:hypothetical protein
MDKAYLLYLSSSWSDYKRKKWMIKMTWQMCSAMPSLMNKQTFTNIGKVIDRYHKRAVVLMFARNQK